VCTVDHSGQPYLYVALIGVTGEKRGRCLVEMNNIFLNIITQAIRALSGYGEVTEALVLVRLSVPTL
jgi:hypothetical protein